MKLTVYLPDDLASRMRETAAADCVSESGFVRALIEREIGGRVSLDPTRLTNSLAFIHIAVDAILEQAGPPEQRATVHKRHRDLMAKISASPGRLANAPEATS